MTARASVLALVFAASYSLAFAVPANFDLSHEAREFLLESLTAIVALKLTLSLLLRGFLGWMRYVTFVDVLQLARSTAITAVAVVALNLLAFQGKIPIGAVVLDALFTMTLVGCLRSTGRFTREILRPRLRRRFGAAKARAALLVGANRNGVAVANQLDTMPKYRVHIAGFLDDDVPALHGSQLAGIEVFGGIEVVAEAAARTAAKEVLVLAGSLDGTALRKLMAACQPAGLPVKVIANVYDLLDGSGSERSLRLRSIEINDLLRREPIALDGPALCSFLDNRVIAVTGAGGSIGSEICRQLLRFNPRAIVLIEKSENNLFHIERELRALNAAPAIHACIADVNDEPRMRQIFALHRPDVLFHAAAHKHVAMMEQNPGEAIKNNIGGTQLLADLAHEHGLKAFVFISTDKAVHPTSVMGLTKQMAERYVHAMSQISQTRFVAVRFGNVLGSAGSVVPIFQEQIRAGGPLTITHPEMRRYFMTIPEASQLVLQAGAMGRGGEIFVLDMGEPVRILDLARDLIRLSGLGPDEIEIRFTGPRKGEKLTEELYFDDEETLPTPHPKVRVARHRPFTVEEVRRLMAELLELSREAESAAITRGLHNLVPEYREDDRWATPSSPEAARPRIQQLHQVTAP
ncbi:MAG: nucleoside-diphosphate sugar epimerase/dehydratase [Gemmataceae bacterium]